MKLNISYFVQYLPGTGMNRVRRPPSHLWTAVRSFGDGWRYWKFTALTITSLRKKILKSKITKSEMTSTCREHFSVHRGQYLSDSDVRGLVFHLRHCISAFARVLWVIRCQKTVSVKCVVTKDRARTLDSELSQGSLGMKIIIIITIDLNYRKFLST